MERQVKAEVRRVSVQTPAPEGRLSLKIISGILAGLILSLVLLLVFTLVLGPMLWSSFGGSLVSAFSPWIVGIGAGVIVGIKSATAAKVWRRMLITTGLLCFSLPLAAFAFTGQLASQMPTGTSAAEHAGAAAGAAVSGILIGGFLGFIGFFAGAIFLVIGLLVGRDPKVVYVQAQPRERQ